MMIPYENVDLLTKIKSLADDVVTQNGVSWREPDYKKSKAYFYISEGEVNLSVEVFPRRYSAIEKQNILETANKEELENGWSEDLALMNMLGGRSVSFRINTG